MKKQIFSTLVLSIGILLPFSLHSQEQRKKVGVVLSGGGAKGMAHIKALQVIEEAGIPIDYIAGTSMGAIVGGLYAIGYTPEQLDSMVRKQDWTFLLSDRIKRSAMSLTDRERSEKYTVSIPFTKTPKDAAAGGLMKGALPYGCEKYLKIEGNGSRNPKYALSPSYNNQQPRALFDYELGMVTQKFAKYAGDKRYKQYVNTSNNTREGMFFMEGKIANSSISGGYAKNPDNQYVLYLLDQVGRFEGNAESGYIANPNYQESKLGNGDFNSGLYCVKYPFYPFDGGYFIESDYTEIRLAEIIYSQAECLLRLGQAGEAGKLLNSVRKRNYENFTADIAYQPEGNVVLDLKEMLDEWGREFLAESRRRTDLIRFGRFQDAWWDKKRDADTHYELFPFSQTQLEQNEYLKQNPGYPDIAR